MLHTSLGEYRWHFKGTVRTVTPTVASGREYYLQTAHLESGTLAFSLESQPASKTTEGRVANLPTSAVPHTGVTSRLNSLFSLVHTRGKFSDTEQ